MAEAWGCVVRASFLLGHPRPGWVIPLVCVTFPGEFPSSLIMSVIILNEYHRDYYTVRPPPYRH